MELDVTQALLNPGEAFPFSEKIGVSPQDVSGETVAFEDVALTGTYSAMDGAVRLKGSLSAKAHAPCAMCLKDVALPMEIPFAETFRKDAVETEDEAFAYEGSKVSLDHLSLTLLVLNLPMRFLCGEECRGSKEYRRYSAIDGNSFKEDTQRPFEALKQLLKEDEEV
jgi:uncharacterized protein